MKFFVSYKIRVFSFLLIVPEGIEIFVRYSHTCRLIILLIVPEGIEIFLSCYQCFNSHLLIVPEGIEIWFYFNYVYNLSALLIVPEGIEIFFTAWANYINSSFNRTRRNWNAVCIPFAVRMVLAFNRTRRNWNETKMSLLFSAKKLLIVPEGIEICRQSKRYRPCNLLIVPEGIEILPPTLQKNRLFYF